MNLVDDVRIGSIHPAEGLPGRLDAHRRRLADDPRRDPAVRASRPRVTAPRKPLQSTEAPSGPAPTDAAGACPPADEAPGAPPVDPPHLDGIEIVRTSRVRPDGTRAEVVRARLDLAGIVALLSAFTGETIPIDDVHADGDPATGELLLRWSP